MIGKTLRSENYWTNRGIVALHTLQVSCLSDMHSRFYASSKLKKWMCELCTFLHIRSHLLYFRCKIYKQKNTPGVKSVKFMKYIVQLIYDIITYM